MLAVWSTGSVMPSSAVVSDDVLGPLTHPTAGILVRPPGVNKEVGCAHRLLGFHPVGIPSVVVPKDDGVCSFVDDK